MVDYTKCDICIHKDVCKYMDTPKVTAEKFIQAVREVEGSTLFEAIFKCKKYEKRNGNIR